MSEALRQKCFNHTEREASAKCPECKRTFCRECVTEYDDKVLCLTCLSRNRSGVKKTRRGRSFILRAGSFFAGFFLLWFIFYAIGVLLLKIPSEVHEGTLWK